MALGVTDLKKGQIFQLEGVPYRVVDYNQKVVGRGGSIVNVRIKSLLDGRVLDKTFKGNDSIESADIATNTAQYLYTDGVSHFLMDAVSYEQYEISEAIVGGAKGFLKEGDSVQILLFNGQPVSIELPKNIQLKVTYTEDAVKGDTSSSITKDAVMETGITVKVPAFIKQNDIISVDTTTGNYRERIK